VIASASPCKCGSFWADSVGGGGFGVEACSDAATGSGAEASSDAAIGSGAEVRCDAAPGLGAEGGDDGSFEAVNDGGQLFRVRGNWWYLLGVVPR